VIVLGASGKGKVALVTAVSRDLTDRLDAGKIAKQVAGIVDGKGGGRKDLAEAGGKLPKKLDESIDAVYGIVERML
jgi:alanyl-tRNA synthetase